MSGYQVIADNFVGNGPTPGLALRDLWRSIENAAMQGRPCPFALLPRRRQYAIQRRFQSSRAIPSETNEP